MRTVFLLMPAVVLVSCGGGYPGGPNNSNQVDSDGATLAAGRELELSPAMEPDGPPPPSPDDGQPREESQERRLDQVLLDAGEHPDAVFLFGRMREVVNESNLALGRRLLEELTEEYPGSLVLEEARVFLQGRYAR